MGYSYTAAGKLCCDVCDNDGGVKKYPCPFGWCQPIALCPECKAKHPEYVSKAHHRERGCERQHLEFERQKKERQDLIDAGQVVRCAALSHQEHPGPNIKVIFKGKIGERAFWMSQETYHSLPLVDNATPADYRRHGPIMEARNVDLLDAELEEVAVHA
jgi:hypothetical protein